MLHPNHPLAMGPHIKFGHPIPVKVRGNRGEVTANALIGQRVFRFRHPYKRDKWLLPLRAMNNPTEKKSRQQIKYHKAGQILPDRHHLRVGRHNNLRTARQPKHRNSLFGVSNITEGKWPESGLQKKQKT